MKITKDPPSSGDRSVAGFILGFYRTHSIYILCFITAVIVAFTSRYSITNQQLYNRAYPVIPSLSKPAPLSQASAFPSIHPLMVHTVYPTAAMTAFQPSASSPSPTSTPPPIPEQFTWKTYAYNDPVFGMSFDYPSFWSLQEDQAPYKRGGSRAYRKITSTGDVYQDIFTNEMLTYDGVNKYQNVELTDLRTIYSARSLNEVTQFGIFQAPIYAVGVSSLTTPAGLRYVENKNGSLRGYSFYSNTRQFASDQIELGLLSVILTDNKNRIVQISIGHNHNDIVQHDGYASVNYEAVEQLACDTGISLSSKAVKCYINKVFYGDYERIYEPMVESITLH